MTRARKRLLLATGVVLAFAAGFGWQYLRAERLDDRLEETVRELEMARLEATLGAAAVEAQRGGFEAARQLTSEFFTGLQRQMDRVPADERRELEEILGRRDQLITLLSRGDPEGRDLLVRTFQGYRVAVGGPDEAIPVAAPETAPEPPEPEQR